MTIYGDFQNSIAAADKLLDMYVELRRSRGLGQRGGLSAANIDLLWLPRSAVVASLSALDAYVHSVVYDRLPHALQLSPIPQSLCEAMSSILAIKNAEGFRNAAPIIASTDSFAELSRLLKEKTLVFVSYQAPEKIIAAYDLIGQNNIFDRVSAMWPGPGTSADDIKRYLANYVKRRNQIAHEGDLEHGGRERSMQPLYAQNCKEFVVNLTSRLNRVVYGI